MTHIKLHYPFFLDLNENCVRDQGSDYRGTWSISSSGAECINWNTTLLRGKKFTARKPDTRILGLGNHNYCRYLDKKQTIKKMFFFCWFNFYFFLEIQMGTPDHGAMFIKSLKLCGNSVQCPTVQQVTQTHIHTHTHSAYGKVYTPLMNRSLLTKAPASVEKKQPQ